MGTAYLTEGDHSVDADASTPGPIALACAMVSDDETKRLRALEDQVSFLTSVWRWRESRRPQSRTVLRPVAVEPVADEGPELTEELELSEALRFGDRSFGPPLVDHRLELGFRER